MIIKTPTGLVQVDKASKVMTQAEYDALPEYKRNEGTYYITDSTDETDYIGDILTLIGVVGDTDISYIEDGTLTTITSNLYKNKADQSDVSQIKAELEIIKDIVNGSGTDITIIGTTDISKIADGTLTGAIVYLNNNIISREVFDALSGKVNAAIASIEDKADISDLRTVLSKAEQNESDIHNLSITKANQSSIDDLQRLITANSNNIAILVKNKADISDLATIEDKVSNNVTLISGLSTNKANQSEVDSIVLEISKIKQQIQNGGGGTGGGGNYDGIIGSADISDIGDGTLTGGLRKLADTRVSKADLTTALLAKADAETVDTIASHITEIDNSIYTMDFDISVLQTNKADLVYVNARLDALNTKIEAVNWDPGDADISRIGDGTITGAILYNYEYKADRTELEPIKRDVLSNTTAITALSDSKADRGDIDKFVTELGNKATKTEVNTLKSIVEENALLVKNKADQSDFEALDKKVQTNIGDITFLYANKVDRSEIEGLVTDITNLATRSELNTAVVTINNKILEVKDTIGYDDISDLGPNHTSAILKLDYMKASRESVEGLTEDVESLQELADGTRSDLDTVISKVDDMYDNIGDKYNIGDTWIKDIGDGTITGAIRKTYDTKADNVTVERLKGSVDIFFDALTYKANTSDVDSKFTLVNESIDSINETLPLKADKTELEPIKEELTEIHEDIKALGIDGIKETLDSKADKTVVDAIDQRLVNAEEAVSTKAEQTDLEALEAKHDTLQTVVTGQANLIQENADAIKTKLDKVELDAVNTAITSLTGRVSTNETKIADNTALIKTKADKSTVDTLSGNLNNLTARVESTEDLVEDIESRVNDNTTKINRIDTTIGDASELEDGDTIIDVLLDLQQNKADSSDVTNLSLIVTQNKKDIKTLQDKIEDITESDLAIIGDTDISDIGDGTLTGGLRKTFDIKANKLDVDTAIGDLQGSIDTANQSIETLHTEVGKKVDKTVFDALSATVGLHTTAISAIENSIDEIVEDVYDLDLRLGDEDISNIGDSITEAILTLQDTKLSNADLETIRDTLEDHTTKITANIAAIATKANQSDLEITNKNVSDNTTAIDANTTDIASLKTSKADKADLLLTNKTISDLALLVEKKANITDVDDAIDVVNTKIAGNTSAIEQNTEAIDTINSVIDSVSGDILDLTELIDTKADKTELELTNKSVADLKKDVDAKPDKAYVDTKASELNTKIETNAGNIDKNTEAITTVNTKISGLEEDIEANTTKITALGNSKADKTALDQTNLKLTNLETKVDLKADITYVDDSISEVTELAEQNAKDIVTANTAISTNTSDIASLKTNKAEKTALEETNANIANLTTTVNKKTDKTYVDAQDDILSGKIDEHAERIDTNASDIAAINAIIDSVSGDLTDLTDLIDTKADKTALAETNTNLENLDARVATNEEDIDKLKTDLKNATPDKFMIGNAKTTGFNKWFKACWYTVTDYVNTNVNIIFAVTKPFSLDSDSAASGILSINIRYTKADAAMYVTKFKWLSNSGFNPNNFIITISNLTCTLYVKNDSGDTACNRFYFEVLSKSGSTYQSLIINNNDSIEAIPEAIDPVPTAVSQPATIEASNVILDTISGLSAGDAQTAIKELYTNKAEKSALNTTNTNVTNLTTRVTTAEGKIVLLQESIDELGDIINLSIIGDTDISSIGDGTLTGAVAKLNDTKASKTDLDTTNTNITNLTTRVTTAEENIVTNKNSIVGLTTKIDAVETEITDLEAAKADKVHKHVIKDITDFPTSMPASDVYEWAKQPNKPTYTATEVGADAAGSADAVLTLAKSYTDKEITDLIDGAPETLDTLKELADVITGNSEIIDNINDAILSKADKTDVEELRLHVTMNEMNLETLIDNTGRTFIEINTNITNLTTRVTTAETNITSLTDTKADKSTVDKIDTRLTTAEAKITDLQDTISDITEINDTIIDLDKRVVKNTTDIATLNTTKANQSDLDITNTNVTNLTTKVTSVEADLTSHINNTNIHMPTLETLNTARYLGNDGTWRTITPSYIGLGNVDNTSDKDKIVNMARSLPFGMATAADAKTFTVNISQITAYGDGITILVQFNTTPIANATLNINSLGALPIIYADSNTGANFIQGAVYEFVYTNNKFMAVHSINTDRVIEIKANGTTEIPLLGANRALTDLPSGNSAYTTTGIVTDKITMNPSTGVLKATTFTGELTGNASSADKLKTARTITLTGGVTGSGSFDGSGNLTISTTIAAHSHSEYLPLSGGTMTGTIRSTRAVILDTNIGDNGIILYQNSTSFYIMLKDIGSGSGNSWNTLRPFSINLTSGLVTMSNGVKVSGGINTDKIMLNGSTILFSEGYNAEFTMANVFNTNDTSAIKRNIIRFPAASGSSDFGFIYHETSSLAEDANKGVLHLSPSDDINNETDYVSIHGYNKPEAIKLYTGGRIWTAGFITAEAGFTGELTGNASSAAKLKTARTISLAGGVTGSGTFDGSSDLTINTTMAAHSHSEYLPLAGGTMTGVINSSVNTSTRINGFNGKAIINSTSSSTCKMLASMKTTNGVFTMGIWNGAYDILYATNELIAEGVNNQTAKVELLNENGDSTFNNIIATTLSGELNGNASTATKLKTARTITFTGSITGSGSFDGSSNLTINTTMAAHSHSEYLPLAGGTMTGTIKSTTANNNILDTNIDNKGFILRQDSNVIDILPKDSGDSSTYNSLRPFRVYLATGLVEMKNGVGVSGGLTVSGNSVFNGKIALPNTTMNDIGDDVQIGDTGQDGHLSIMAKSASTKPTGIEFYKKGTITPSGKLADSASLDWDGEQLSADKTVSVPEIKIGDAVSLVYDSINKCLNFNFA